MATIAENLQIIKDSTDAIKQAIIDKGGDVSGDISTWAEAITGISGEGGSEEVTLIGSVTVSNATTFKIYGILKGSYKYYNFCAMYRSQGGEIISSSFLADDNTIISLTLDVEEPLSYSEIPLFFIYKIGGKVIPVTFINNPAFEGTNPN